MEDDVLHIWHYGTDSEQYIKNAQVNSRENLNVTEEVITFDKPEDSYTDMLDNFAQAVISGDKTLITAPGEEAINQMMLTNSAYYSAWTGKKVVLPLDADLYESELEKHCEEERVSNVK